MYLTAQRVRHPNGPEGINAFYYSSGVDVWAPDFRPPRTPDADPGELVHEIITLAPPGNRVRSYLDIVAGDRTPAVTIRRVFASAAWAAQPRELPFAVEIAPCWFRFGTERAVAPMWRQEVRMLFEWAILAYLQTSQAP
jgi:hypothetical protein